MSLDNTGGDRILGLIKRRGPLRSADVAAVLGTTAEAARQQLVKLADDGLVEAVTEKQGVGRPARYWHLTPAAHNRFPDTHAELTVRLIDAVRSTLGEAALEQLVRVREEETRRSYAGALSGATTLGARVARLAEVRSREGYMAEWRADGQRAFCCWRTIARSAPPPRPARVSAAPNSICSAMCWARERRWSASSMPSRERVAARTASLTLRPGRRRTMSWTDVMSLAKLAEDGKAVVRHGGRQILLVHSEAGIFACVNRCPHEGYPLSEGTLTDGCVLTCNWHNWKFNLASGATLVGGDRLTRYPVRFEAGRVWLDLSPPNPDTRREEILAGVVRGLEDLDQQRLVRETARLSRLQADPADAVRAAITWAAERLEFGTTHAIAGAADWLRLFDRLSSSPEEKLAALGEILGHIADDARGDGHYPYPAAAGSWNEAGISGCGGARGRSGGHRPVAKRVVHRADAGRPAADPCRRRPGSLRRLRPLVDLCRQDDRTDAAPGFGGGRTTAVPPRAEFDLRAARGFAAGVPRLCEVRLPTGVRPPCPARRWMPWPYVGWHRNPRWPPSPHGEGAIRPTRSSMCLLRLPRGTCCT